MIKKYGLLGSLGLFISLVRTKFLFKRARLIRFPIDIRNKHLMTIDKGFTTGKYCRLEAHNEGSIRLKIGKNVQVNDSVHIVSGISVILEDNVLIASKVFISDCSHGSYGNNDYHDNTESIPADRELHYQSVKICKNAWLGEFVSVLPGVTIGEGSIIGTMSVVTKDIPPYCIAVGSPAKVVKKFNFKINKWEKTV
jgi:acetyltransferase-like isoleucine patch superfamily enzyme